MVPASSVRMCSIVVHSSCLSLACSQHPDKLLYHKLDLGSITPPTISLQVHGNKIRRTKNCMEMETGACPFQKRSMPNLLVKVPDDVTQSPPLDVYCNSRPRSNRRAWVPQGETSYGDEFVIPQLGKETHKIGVLHQTKTPTHTSCKQHI